MSGPTSASKTRSPSFVPAASRTRNNGRSRSHKAKPAEIAEKVLPQADRNPPSSPKRLKGPEQEGSAVTDQSVVVPLRLAPVANPVDIQPFQLCPLAPSEASILATKVAQLEATIALLQQQMKELTERERASLITRGELVAEHRIMGGQVQRLTEQLNFSKARESALTTQLNDAEKRGNELAAELGKVRASSALEIEALTRQLADAKEAHARDQSPPADASTSTETSPGTDQLAQSPPVDESASTDVVDELFG